MTATTTAADLTAAMATLLRTNAKNVQSRLAGLGFTQVCGRCGGGGQYSYCQMYGTTCFGCSGSGKVAMKLTPKLLSEVQAAVDAGKLDAYLTELRRKQVAAKQAETLVSRLLAAWEAIPAVARGKGIHFTKCDALHHAANAAAHPFYEKVSALANAIKLGQWDKANRRMVKLTDAERDAALAEAEALILQVVAMQQAPEWQ